MSRIVLLVLSAAIVTGGCAPGQEAARAEPAAGPWRVVAERNVRDGAVDRFDPTVDYFPEKTAFRHSEQVRIDYYGHYKVLTVTPSPNPNEQFQYVLVQRGTPAPRLPGRTTVIEVPLRNFVLTHGELLGAAEITGLAGKLLAVDDVRNVRAPGIRRGIEQGRIVAVGSGKHVDVERVIQLQPDAVLTYWSVQPQYDAHPVLDQAGIRTVILASHWESAILGVTEWMKVLAVLFNRERDVNTIFDGIAARYLSLSTRARAEPRHPLVLTRLPFRHIWSVTPEPDEIVDAGGRYLWPGETRYHGVDIESVVRRGRDADVWIVSFPTPIRTVDELISREPRLAIFKAVQTGQVWNFDRQAFDQTAAWHDRPMRPDLVLADVVKILHPELVPEHQFVFYRQLESPSGTAFP